MSRVNQQSDREEEKVVFQFSVKMIPLFAEKHLTLTLNCFPSRNS
jgi:hypothetical protein